MEEQTTPNDECKNGNVQTAAQRCVPYLPVCGSRAGRNQHPAFEVKVQSEKRYIELLDICYLRSPTDPRYHKQVPPNNSKCGIMFLAFGMQEHAD